MKRKIILALSLVAILTVLFAISVSAAEPVETWDISATENDSVTATYYDDNSLIVSGSGDMKNWDNVYTPWYHLYRRVIKSITIENGVTSIGDYAFSYCSSLVSVAIGDSVTSIGSWAFNNCYCLLNVEIPNGVKSIADGLFYSCIELESVIIPNSVESIGADSFHNCSNLTSIEIPDGVTTIDEYVFYGCTNLAIDRIPDSVTSIGNYAFFNCDSITNVVVPKNVTSIGDYAFCECFNLINVVVGNSVTSIGKWAFSCCNNLTSIEIPEKVTNIGEYAFRSCQNLQFINVEKENKSYKSIDGSLYSYDGKILYQYAVGKNGTSFEIPEGVITIYDYACYDKDNITNIVIPDSVRSIGVAAFESCTNLESVMIGVGTENIGKLAFDSCSNLKSIVIPDNVTSISESMFRLCNNLTKVVIGEGVTSIGGGAFLACENLTSIVIPNGVINISDYSFKECSKLTIYAEVETQPNGWATNWNYSNCPVVWDYKNVIKNDVLTFKGYSFGESGAIAVGYDIDYERKAFYEELTGEALEIGVLFAGFDNLGGNQPLGENSEAIVLNVGKVIKADLTEFSYKNYDFVLTDIDDSIKDVLLVISAYIYDREVVKYIQENGISDTVTGVSYNEAKESVAQ